MTLYFVFDQKNSPLNMARQHLLEKKNFSCFFVLNMTIPLQKRKC